MQSKFVHIPIFLFINYSTRVYISLYVHNFGLVVLSIVRIIKNMFYEKKCNLIQAIKYRHTFYYIHTYYITKNWLYFEISITDFDIIRFVMIVFISHQ